MPAPRERKPKAKPINPIEKAISGWLHGLSSRHENIDTQELLGVSPKRWVAYEPMVLLPSGSFTSTPWLAVMSSVGKERMSNLWASILAEISTKHKTPLTHLAVNEGIPLHTKSDGGDAENVLRSPSGLRMLYGDFGPSRLSTSGEVTEERLTRDDFDAAFWVSTKQNGIRQTWAPRWTMFSRGNVTEKARMLEFHARKDGSAVPALQHRILPAASLKDKWAVDLYAGIGYFVFSYARLGMRVLCWEINPWSVEGLRRGAVMNGWSVRLVQGDELKVQLGDVMSGGENIVVFLEDNREAVRRIQQFRQKGHELNILHVNCGFLPTSEPVWADAWEMVQTNDEAWLHLHENVGAADVETRQNQIQKRFEDLAQGDGAQLKAKVEHVELVKTFAPGVEHCVFDVYLTKSRTLS